MASHWETVADAVIYSPFKVALVLISFDCKNLVIALVASGFAVKSATSSLVKNLPYLADLGSLTSYKIFSRVSRFLILLLSLLLLLVVVILLLMVVILLTMVVIVVYNIW